MLRISDSVVIPEWELTEQFLRASGPGGQNVNKVSSAVELRFDAARSPSLAPAVKSRLRRLAGRRWNREGAVVLQVDETRSQSRNRAIARARLTALIRAALEPPRPRIPTAPPPGSKRRRLADKRARAGVKALRGRIGPES